MKAGPNDKSFRSVNPTYGACVVISVLTAVVTSMVISGSPEYKNVLTSDPAEKSVGVSCPSPAQADRYTENGHNAACPSSSEAPHEQQAETAARYRIP